MDYPEGETPQTERAYIKQVQAHTNKSRHSKYKSKKDIPNASPDTPNPSPDIPNTYFRVNKTPKVLPSKPAGRKCTAWGGSAYH